MPIPRVVGCAEEFEFTGDGGPLAAAETYLGPLTERVAPKCGDFVAQFGDERGGGLEARLKIEADLMFGHAGKKRLELPKVGRPRSDRV